VTSVALLRIALDWFRCPKGYRLVRAKEVARALGQHPSSYPDEDWVVPNSEERVGYRPLDKYDLLCVAFSKVKTPDDLLGFIDLYGPLTRSSPVWGDSVPGCLRSSRRFYELLICKDRGPKRLASVFNAQVKAGLARAYEDAEVPLPKDYDHGELNQSVGTADIVADLARGIQIRITTEVLIGGLWWQLAQKLSGETNIQICRYCNSPFETGPGTGRHLDAAFCCNEHKVRYFSLARTKRKRRE
jgi:hypothetical protein